MGRALASDLLAWFVEHGRDLPWRRTRDPYAIWVAEVMLQQTRVETVLPYYARFMDRFPDLRTLAEAPEADVLRLWEGMGYYSRARHLHRAAKEVLARFGGQISQDPAELEGLPGVGRYTAAAIAAIAFGKDALSLDGNLRRVLARLFDVHLDPRSPAGERELIRRGLEILPAGQASAFNQSLMDLGARICTPRAPGCPVCPVARHCLARRHGTQEQLPVRTARRAIPERRAVAAVWRENGKVLLLRHPPVGLLAGLWGFPGGLLAEGEADQAGLARLIGEQLGVRILVGDALQPLKHAYSHYRVRLQPFACRGAGRSIRERPEARWVELSELATVPMGKLDRQLADRVRANFLF